MTALQERPESQSEPFEVSEEVLNGLSIARFGRIVAEQTSGYAAALSAVPLELSSDEVRQIHDGVYDVMAKQCDKNKARLAADRALMALANRLDEDSETTAHIFEAIKNEGYKTLGQRLLEIM